LAKLTKGAPSRLSYILPFRLISAELLGYKLIDRSVDTDIAIHIIICGEFRGVL